MSDEKEYRKYDSYATISCQEMRLAKDAEVISPGFVKLTTVMTSSNAKDADTWLTVIPQERDAENAALLRKGDVFHFTGFPVTQRWGDKNDKIDFVVKFPKLVFPQATRAAIKERGNAPAPANKKAKKLINLDD